MKLVQPAVNIDWPCLRSHLDYLPIPASRCGQYMPLFPACKGIILGLTIPLPCVFSSFPFHQAVVIAGKLFHEEGVSTFKLYLMPWVQIPLWVILSYALRNMTGFFSDLTPPFLPGSPASMAGEGVLWFPDLTVVDPYMILPIILAVTNLLNIEVRLVNPPLKWQKRVGRLLNFDLSAPFSLFSFLCISLSLSCPTQLHSAGRRQVTRRARITTNMLRVLSIAIGYISTQMPSVSSNWAKDVISAPE